MIPERKWAFDLIGLKNMPRHIYHHSMLVRRIAVTIACFLKDGTNVNIDLVDRGALLHDICKMDSIATGGDHASMGQRLLEILGYPILGQVVGQHVRLKALALSEALIVNYADKRVMHDKVVSLSGRFADLMERYGQDEVRREKIMQLYACSLAMEEIIFSATGMYPLRLNNLNLIPENHAFYGGHGIRGEHGSVELQDEDVYPKGVNKDQPSLIHK